MDRIDQLERDIARLSLAVRLGLAAVIIGFLARSFTTLARAKQLGMIFEDLFGGKPLPPLTQFFLAFSTHISVGLSVFGLAAVALLFVRPRAVWSMPVGVFVAVTSIVISETALLALQAPFLSIISQLTA